MMLSLFIAAAISAYSQTFDPLGFDVTKLTADAVVVSGHQYNVNVLAVRTDDGIILVDTGISPAWASAVRDTLQRIFATDRFHYVINTHYHWDHVQGNQVFPDAIIVAQERCRKAMERQNNQRRGQRPASQSGQSEGDKGDGTRLPPPPSPILTNGKAGFHLCVPTLTVADRMILTSGKTTVEIVAYGYGHSDNDLIVYFTQSGILATGDLFFNHVLPIIKPWGQSHIERSLTVLGEFLEEERTITAVVPGHNECMTREDLEQHYTYLAGLSKGVSRIAAAGEEWESAREEFRLESFAPQLTLWDVRSNNGNSLHEGNVRNLWRVFTGEENGQR